ncbi:hypothetical protein CSO01_22880 [Cellulomonas soli]|uniref:N-acetyltransferase domain-containing protein n=1 Tax=Cellulomonas soli TaxID=931535 RepID=A0A512PEH5_9CELL|nr:hypothetical protein CSO01_22880 [Cellulomonas soli]
MLRAGEAADLTACVALWLDAFTAREGAAVDGVVERARPKFSRAEAWVVADDGPGGIRGFALATPPGSGLPGDPAEAAVVGLLAVSPAAQGHGLGRHLLHALTADLARRGHRSAALHVLLDNRPAVRLYEDAGWTPWGEPHPHALLGRLAQTYVVDLSV